jgi:excisionase family DNA binding protein
MNSKNKILSMDEAAEMLKCTKQTLFNWHRKGILKYRKVGKKRLYYESDIHEVLNQN